MVGMSMERGGFGNVARAEVLCEEESLLERARPLLGCARDRWAGAAAAAAGAGAWAAVDLLASACSSSTATAGLFDMKLLKETQHLQLEHAGKLRSIPSEPSRGRVGSARCSATVWCVGRIEAGAFVVSVRAWEQHVRAWSARDWAVCAHVVLWAAVRCACALFACVACMWAVLMDMEDTGA